MAKSKVDYWLTDDGLTLLKGWARDGLTDEQIAYNCGLKNRKTLYDWKKKHSNISNALKKGKEVVDIEVENALLKNALGYYYVEETVSTKKEVIYKNGKRLKEISEPVVVELQRYKHPETMAQMYWLNNRKPEQWRNKREHDKEKEEKDDSGVVIVDDLPKWKQEDS